MKVKNGDVDGADLAIFAAHFGRTDCDQGNSAKATLITTELWTAAILLYLPQTLAGQIARRVSKGISI